MATLQDFLMDPEVLVEGDAEAVALDAALGGA